MLPMSSTNKKLNSMGSQQLNDNDHSIDSATNAQIQLQQSQTSAGGLAADGTQLGGSNGNDVGVIIACNKWRPYYYDMFNRVGNLTLLSLSRRRNSIIESLHTFTHENRNWHERFNLRFPEEEQSDFASVRIYWDYRNKDEKDGDAIAKDDKKDKEGDVQMSQHQPMSK